MDLFKLHSEKCIGYKKLSAADLGLSTKSHQTHFGLFDDVLTFLPNSIDIPDAIFIYKEQCEYVDVAFGRIRNPNGSYRSPKVSTGADNNRSLLRLIRNKASKAPLSVSWFLLWFGLANEQPVFFLVDDLSSDYEKLLSIGIPLAEENPSGRIHECNSLFEGVVEFIESKINKVRSDDGPLLELACQGHKVERPYRPKDYAAAQTKFSEVGRKGEELIDCYLSNLLNTGEIYSYKWMNRNGESYNPYDFEYSITPKGKTQYIEVKTTGYDFNQLMFFSSQEITFASEHNSQYHIFRVYKKTNDTYSLKKTIGDMDLFQVLYDQYFLYKTSSAPYGIVTLAKLEIDPLNKNLQFGECISLN